MVIGKFTNSLYISIVPLPDRNSRIERLLVNLELMKAEYLEKEESETSWYGQEYQNKYNAKVTEFNSKKQEINR